MRKEYEHLKVAMAEKEEEVRVGKGLNVDREFKEGPGKLCARWSVVSRGRITASSTERNGITANSTE